MPSDLKKKTRLLVKICGLQSSEDVRRCLELGVDMLGFIFAPQSPRRVEAEKVAGLPRGHALRVGVFAGQSADTVCRIMEQAGLDYAQLHGDEDPAFCRAVGADRVIKTLWPERLLRRPAQTGETAALSASLQALLQEECASFSGCCSFFLLDAGARGGGTGRTLPWDLLRGFAPPVPWLLAGGIAPVNAALAVACCDPPGIDCASGVEEAPGKKNAALLEGLMRTIRNRK